MVLIEYLLKASREGYPEKLTRGGESLKIGSFPFHFAPALGAMVDQMRFNAVRVRNEFEAFEI